MVHTALDAGIVLRNVLAGLAERDLRKWSEVTSSTGDLPALFQEQTTPHFDSAANIPTIRTLQADLAIIIDASDTKIIPAIAMNEAVDAVIAALAPNAATLAAKQNAAALRKAAAAANPVGGVDISRLTPEQHREASEELVLVQAVEERARTFKRTDLGRDVPMDRASIVKLCEIARRAVLIEDHE